MSHDLFWFGCLIWFLVIIFGLVRIEVASRIRMRRLDEISARADELITQRKFWGHLYDEFRDGPSMRAIAFDLTKWTVRSVYKEF